MTNDYSKTLILDTNARYYGISILDLMERAGHGAADFIIKKFGKNKKIAIFCGLGNNGGDGFVAARHLMRNNEVTVFLVGEEEEIRTKEARKNWKRIKNYELRIKKLKIIEDAWSPAFRQRLAHPKGWTPNIVIDALFGVGARGKLKEPYVSIVEKLNKLKGKKVAIDVPSPGFKADYVVSMHYPKTPGAYVVDIGLGEVEQKIGPGEVKALYKPPFDSRKGQNGQLMIIAGSKRYHGALIFATKMAAKIVDLVFVSSTVENNEIIKKIRSKLAEFIVVPRDKVEKFIKRCDAVLIGPGMGISEETRNITNYLLKKYPNKKFVLDADALKLANPRLLGENCILTPHAGEFQEFFKIKATPKNVAKMAEKYNCIIVLKGQVDVICSGLRQAQAINYSLSEVQRSRRAICKKDYAGNAGLTKGGTGDVLAGLIAALACKNDLFLSACAGTFLLGKSGERLFEKFSYYYNPSDLISEISKTIKWCEEF